MSIRRVTVYAASSQALAPDYTNAARQLGTTLAEAGIVIAYGGGSRGLMGAMADAALAAGGEIHGIIPEFLTQLEQGHQQLTSLEVVTSMHARKQRMLEHSDAVIALPGGCGTLEELFEAVTLKRLGQFLGPIVLVNTNRYYDGLLSFLGQSVRERFMNRTHLDLWQAVDQPEQVLEVLTHTPAWSAGLHGAAVVRGRS